jgi:hypothetical protein
LSAASIKREFRPCQLLCRLTACLLLLASCGCQRGPEEVHVHGTVTFNGAPVPLGQVIIQPDGTKENRGHQGFALIKNGQFDTRGEKGRGGIHGAVKVLVSGGNGVGVEALVPYGEKLFEEYQFPAEIPAEGTELNIEVPTPARPVPTRVVR